MLRQRMWYATSCEIACHYGADAAQFLLIEGDSSGPFKNGEENVRDKYGKGKEKKKDSQSSIHFAIFRQKYDRVLIK
ncbi:hypothetical protein A4A49_09540 [Nicotiana attenuata]|uniref:Uncharacterized protein n=1 Tax=Nicotiana attenuata TaxID=49451 RepID=A0A1J6IN29_NICAT|nr:hypothetical protein A4A49_09540 [Nicotiana attenuata]